MEEILKLKCRQCETVIELNKDGLVECGCGNCSFGIKDGKVSINSKNGVSGFTLYDNNDEFILLPRQSV